MKQVLNFLVTAPSDADLRELLQKDPTKDWDQFLTGERCWSLKTALMLQQSGMNVVVSRHYRPSAINFAHSAYIRNYPPERDIFVISLQAEYRRCRIAHINIVQNKRQLGSRNIWILHWPMEGIVPRSVDRVLVRNVALAGLSTNLAGGQQAWQQMLAAEGLSFTVLDPAVCNDFSNIDVLVGVRSFTRDTWNNRPGWKMINAWSGRVPFIGGWDSAYSQLGTPGIDYLRVNNQETLVTVLRQLRDEPEYYNSFVDAGRRKVENFTSSIVLDQWIECITEKIAPVYDNWRRRGVAGMQLERAKHLTWRLEEALRAGVRRLRP